MIQHKINIAGLLEEYFDNQSREINLAKGEMLLEEHDHNSRLYVIKSGRMGGYVSDGEGNFYELFRATEGMFVGVYSFFSKTFVSVTRLVAEEPTKLAYIEAEDFENRKVKNERKAQEDAIFLLVNEIYSRQQLAHEVMKEKSNALKKLLQADKMATLGQMAAGLAHELNNAIMVLSRNTEWVGQAVNDMIATRLKENHNAFARGMESGAAISTEEGREIGKMLSKELGLSRQLAKNLAKTGFSINELQGVKDKELEDLYQYWELGSAFRDMSIAADHAIHVVKSVKELGANRSERQSGIQLNDTIQEAITILKSPLRRVKLETSLTPLPTLYANRGELVQIWINLIKNACEALEQTKVDSPAISIVTRKYRARAKIEILDNGPGIPKEIVDKIFQPSFTTKVGGLSFGLGLGLSIVQRLVESYEGKIGVTSRPGETKFTVEIPIDYGKY